MRSNKDAESFIIKFLILVTIAVLLVGYCEYRLRKVENSYSYKKEKFEKNIDNIEVLIMGSSESLHGINPEFLNLKGFNLANVSQSLYYDKELIIKYINQLQKIKVVILSISYFSLWYDVYNNSIEYWRDYYYYHFWGINTNANESFNLKKYSYISLYGTDFTQLSLFENFPNLPDLTTENGFLPNSQYLQDSFTDTDARNRVGEHNSAMKENSLKSNLLYLHEILEVLRSKGVAVIFVTCPVTKRYFSFANTTKINSILENVNNLCKEYGCIYLYYLNDDRFTDKDFWDFDHLNSNGAEKFTRILNQDIKKYYTR